MPRENNFLIGQGERLTFNVEVPSSGGRKNMPYDFTMTRERLSSNLLATSRYIEELPPEACPRNETVAILTMHPRFVSKSDFPIEFLNRVGLRALGSRQQKIAPDRWGVSRHPETAQTEQIFIAGRRTIFSRLTNTLQSWRETSGAAQNLLKVESISPFTAESKVRSIPENREELLLEVLLHNSNDREIINSFIEYATAKGALVIVESARNIGGLTFIPIKVAREAVIDIARHSFVRVCRGMPTLRPLFPGITRQNVEVDISLPNEGTIDTSVEAVTFDGGIPRDVLPALTPWVSLTEPVGIGPAVPELELHGLAVTSAFLFGVLKPSQVAMRPICYLEHVRVLDQRDIHSKDFEYIDVIERITQYLDTHPGQHKFINISIGPDIPISDDEVSYWTLALDQRLASANTLATVAVGNTGERDVASGLNRIQPPSDAVNVLSVGAADSADEASGSWDRASYSAVGPGRTPGLVKPDGLAFGGTFQNPFFTLYSASSAHPVMGTSFAAPLTLRSSAAIAAQLGNKLNPLTIRALMIHFASDGGRNRLEVGWGRFELDPDRLITCPDNAPTIIYQGNLPVGTHLRVPIPIPNNTTQGYITISTTILISPEIDPGFLGTYTESGFLTVFRKDCERYRHYPDGRRSVHPISSPFFSESSMYGVGEYELREGGLKWEPCAKSSRRFRAVTLNKPCFDIYHHSREEGLSTQRARPIPYALIVTIFAPRIRNLYDQVLRNYATVLVPIQPRLRIQIPT